MFEESLPEISDSQLVRQKTWSNLPQPGQVQQEGQQEKKTQEGSVKSISGTPGSSQFCEGVLPLLYKIKPRPWSLKLGFQ